MPIRTLADFQHGPVEEDPRLPVLSVDNEVTHMAPGWAGRCEVCGHKRWVDGGYALFWAIDGTRKGWHGWGPKGESCDNGCLTKYGGSNVMEPLDLDDQRPYIAAWALGGEEAVLAMFEEAGYKRGRARRRGNSGV